MLKLKDAELKELVNKAENYKKKLNEKKRELYENKSGLEKLKYSNLQMKKMICSILKEK